MHSRTMQNLSCQLHPLHCPVPGPPNGVALRAREQVFSQLD